MLDNSFIHGYLVRGTAAPLCIKVSSMKQESPALLDKPSAARFRQAWGVSIQRLLNLTA